MPVTQETASSLSSSMDTFNVILRSVCGLRNDSNMPWFGCLAKMVSLSKHT